MENENRERDFRIRPPRRKRMPRDEARQWSNAFRQIMHIVRMTRTHTQTNSSRRAVNSGLPRRYSQRCAVRVTYTPGKTAGQWAAHGRYLARESATHADFEQCTAFSSSGPAPDIAALLGSWQKAGDPRLFKLIISPEFGDRLDLEALTSGLMARMETDLGTKLQWVATVHRNTEYPHVHVALRGINDQGSPLLLPRVYIQQGIRANAEQLATNQLGYRSVLDAEEAQRREINQKRYTSLDRVLTRIKGDSPDQAERDGFFAVDLIGRAKPDGHNLAARLLFLQSMGLAEETGSNRWVVRSDFESLLRGIQRASDRQRTLAAHGAILSDPRLPTRLTDVRQLESLAGRVLGHAEDEMTGRSYMIFEGTDHTVHFIYHTRNIEEARHRGQLRPNTFARLTRLAIDGKSVVTIADFGDSEKLLSQKNYIRTAAFVAVKRGAIPVENGWAGWLGRYDAAISTAAAEIQAQRAAARQPKPVGRNRG